MCTENHERQQVKREVEAIVKKHLDERREQRVLELTSNIQHAQRQIEIYEQQIENARSQINKVIDESVDVEKILG